MDPYAVLDVDRSATPEEVKRAYRKLALSRHPDRGGSTEAFQELSAAYGVLSDDTRRALYDATGHIDVAGADQQAPMDFSDVFATVLRGGLFGGEPVPVPEPHPPPPDVIDIGVTLSEVVNGAQKHVEFEALDACGHCAGTRAATPEDIVRCATCSGSGQVQHRPLPFVVAMLPCGACGGQGQAIARPCPKCRGEGTEYNKRSMKLNIPRGISDGHAHVLPGKGSWDESSGRNKDVVLRFTYEAEAGLRVDSDRNVHIVLEAGLDEVLCGFEKRVDLYGRTLDLRAPHYFDPSHRLTVEGWGLPHGRDAGARVGALIVTWRVTYPPDVGERSVKFSEILRKLYKKNAVAPAPEGAVSVVA